MFKGYAEAIEQVWVNGSSDAVSVVSLVDEFKVLALDKLPATDPPSDTYQDLVMFDAPTGYWPMDASTGAVPAAVGEGLVNVNGLSWVTNTQGAIVGQEQGSYVVTTGTSYLQTANLELGQSGDVSALTEMTIEAWYGAVGAFPSSGEIIATGPQSGGINQWRLSFSTAGKFVMQATNSGATTYTVTSTTVATLGTNVWYHVVGTITGGNLRLYVNGVEEASTAFTGSFGTLDTNGKLIVGNNGTTIGANSRHYDEMAFYRAGLPAARVLAHYTAGVSRGFPYQQVTDARIAAVLDAADSIAPRSLGVSNREMTATYMVGQSPLDELRRAETAASTDAVLFTSRDGTITFLAENQRSGSPYDTVQATFDDDGTDFPYQDISLDYSDSFIANEWLVTRTGGNTTTASDATSIAKYFKRTQSLTDLPIVFESDQADIAAAMLAKYKDPMTRITSLTLQSAHVATLDNIFRRDIGDRIRVFRTPPGGGSRIDQQLFVQHISIDATPNKPWRVVWGLSPL